MCRIAYAFRFAQAMNQLTDFIYFYAISCNRLIVWIWGLKLEARSSPNSYAAQPHLGGILGIKMAVIY